MESGAGRHESEIPPEVPEAPPRIGQVPPAAIGRPRQVQCTPDGAGRIGLWARWPRPLIRGASIGLVPSALGSPAEAAPVRNGDYRGGRAVLPRAWEDASCGTGIPPLATIWPWPFLRKHPLRSPRSSQVWRGYGLGSRISTATYTSIPSFRIGRFGRRTKSPGGWRPPASQCTKGWAVPALLGCSGMGKDPPYS